MKTLRLLVDGVFSGGKSTFIQHLSEIRLVSTDYGHGKSQADPEFCPVALDFGRLTFDDDWTCYMFGAPAARLIDPTWLFIDEIDLGIIVVVDSTFRYEIMAREANFKIKMWRWLREELPLVVVANKQDKIDAWHPDMVRVKLNIPPDIPVLPCVATTGDGVAEAVVALCQQYLKTLDSNDTDTD